MRNALHFDTLPIFLVNCCVITCVTCLAQKPCPRKLPRKRLRHGRIARRKRLCERPLPVGKSALTPRKIRQRRCFVQSLILEVGTKALGLVFDRCNRPWGKPKHRPTMTFLCSKLTRKTKLPRLVATESRAGMVQPPSSSFEWLLPMVSAP